MFKQNLHTHSLYCDGKDTIDQMAQTAIQKGFTVLGFFHICDNHILLKFFVMYALCVGSVWVVKYVPVVRRIVS